MRALDYLKLGLAAVRANRKRAFAVVSIVGLLLSVVVAGVFTLQGLENAVFARMLTPTKGKVLVLNNVETKICGEDCDVLAEVQTIKENIQKYQGKVVSAKISLLADEIPYQLDQNVFFNASEVEGAMPVAVPLSTAARLAKIELPQPNIETTGKLNVIRQVWQTAFHQVLTDEVGNKYYIAEILPSAVYAGNLAFTNVSQDGSPLDLIFSQIRTGTSQNFVLEHVSSAKQLPSNLPASDLNAEEIGIVFALFEDIKTAYSYYQDEANYCSETNRAFNTCGKNYRFQVISAVSDPLTTYEKLQNVWLAFRIAAILLASVALIIAISTYIRLIDRDTKIISLYFALGATARQIRIVYTVHTTIISILATGFALGLGCGLAALLSLVNSSPLSQVFTLGFGLVEQSTIWLVGWNWQVLAIPIILLIASILAILLSNRQFSGQKLAKNLK